MGGDTEAAAVSGFHVSGGRDDRGRGQILPGLLRGLRTGLSHCGGGSSLGFGRRGPTGKGGSSAGWRVRGWGREVRKEQELWAGGYGSPQSSAELT